MCSCLHCPWLSELVRFLLWALSVSSYILHRHRVCLVNCVDLTCSLHSWWGGLGSSPLATLPLGYKGDFMSTSACGLSTGVCCWGRPKGLGLSLWGPGVEVVQLLVLRGFWQHQVLRGVGSYGSRKYSVLEGYSKQYWPIHASILAWRAPPWQRTLAGYNLQGREELRHNWNDPVCIDTRLLPVAALPQWGLSMKVAQLLGLWGLWWHQGCGDIGRLHCRSYGPIRVCFWASYSS